MTDIIRQAFLILPVTAMAVTIVAPTAWSKTRVVTCNFRAHIQDRDRSGTNIRQAPRKNARVAARIAPAMRSGKEVARQLRISGQRGNWFRVARVVVRGKTLFRGEGWIHGSLVHVQIRGNAKLYRAPSRKSAVVVDYGTVDVEAASRVYRCRGGWIRVRDLDVRKAGWLPRGSYCDRWVPACE